MASLMFGARFGWENSLQKSKNTQQGEGTPERDPQQTHHDDDPARNEEVLRLVHAPALRRRRRGRAEPGESEPPGIAPGAAAQKRGTNDLSCKSGQTRTNRPLQRRNK